MRARISEIELFVSREIAREKHSFKKFPQIVGGISSEVKPGCYFLGNFKVLLRMFYIFAVVMRNFFTLAKFIFLSFKIIGSSAISSKYTRDFRITISETIGQNLR